MGRRSHSRNLSVWANGLRVGTWTLPSRGEGQLRYDEAWITSAEGRPLSLSLPFLVANRPLQGPRVGHYFDNLLPDSDLIRQRIAQRFGTRSMDPFDLLKAIGRDCVGAIQLLAEEETPEDVFRVSATPLSDNDVEHAITGSMSSTGLAGGRHHEADLRISLAGAQEKTALLRWQGQWQRPQGSTPTTHIVKLPLGLVGGRRADFTTSVDNEWLCLRLMKAFGLDVAEATIERFGDQRVLVVERFDRRVSADGQWIMRLPQEDFCQVTGCSPLRKYESDGGPGLKSLFTTLRQSERAGIDMKTLMTTQILFWLLRAPDGHAKNFSIRLLPGGRFHLTPMYDVMSVYPVIGRGPNQWSPHDVRGAMALLGKNRHYDMQTIQRRHFNSTARKVGYGDTAEPLIEEVLARVPGAVGQVLSELPPDLSPKVVESILGGLLAAADSLAAMPAD
ncbi:type II toxin-antitoxin system HipA family toxin [Luteibacter sp. 22Crub2.1]|uniref:type II toxin-antitoxin system HipA family toxin n=1 Tax=Luteibacter sp. 22Crub2.1 TaxID=1283288 RepID=UPI0009A604B1|nr:type II toxin-antitoxin system HipA family toxin [Luteibacter sp. 22Crub2.1]SKB25957.1 serine/threonine-protein kinase HipA [Luteibacter sp. 22Crub2.1]